MVLKTEAQRERHTNGPVGARSTRALSVGSFHDKDVAHSRSMMASVPQRGTDGGQPLLSPLGKDKLMS